MNVCVVASLHFPVITFLCVSVYFWPSCVKFKSHIGEKHRSLIETNTRMPNVRINQRHLTIYRLIPPHWLRFHPVTDDSGNAACKLINANEYNPDSSHIHGGTRSWAEKGSRSRPVDLVWALYHSWTYYFRAVTFTSFVVIHRPPQR